MNIASSPGSTDEVLAGAVTDQESIVALTQQLVQIPSQAGIDPYEPILSCLESWLVGHGLNPRCMHAANPDGIGVETVDGIGVETVALACELDGGHPGPRYVLDACVDTASFGDLDAWRHPPTSGVIDSGWLHGRGSTDSKVGAAIIAHVATRLRQQLPRLHGSLTLLLDADEHTGQFGGAKRYFAGPDAPGDVAGVMIGYSGLDKVVIGGRGFLRAQVTLYGEADHSGSSRSETNNAVERAAAWVEDLTQRRRPQLPAADKTFGPPPKLTVTAIHGGHGYSTLPDCCTVNVDVRLTPTFDRQAAVDLLEEAAREFDRRWPAPRPTRLDYLESWPPYRLSKRLPPCAALTEAAACYLPNAPRMKVAGPSNIGNYLAQLGIPATAGFGVVYRGLHGTDESINLVAVILFPVCAGMSAAARELVRVVVGHQWGPAGALVPWLAFAGGFAVLAKLSRALAEARAELNRSLAAQGAQLPMLATRLLLSARSGQLWLFAAAVAASGLARLLAYLALMRRVLALRLAELARALAPAVLTSAAAGLAVAGARHALVGTAPVAVVFAVEVAAGAVALALCLRLAALAQVRAELGRRLADVGLRGAAGSWRRRLLMLAVGPTEPVAAGGLHLARPRHLAGRGR